MYFFSDHRSEKPSYLHRDSASSLGAKTLCFCCTALCVSACLSMCCVCPLQQRGSGLVLHSAARGLPVASCQHY